MDGARGLVAAHVDLAKAEAGEIMGEVKRVAVLAGIAFGALVVVGFLLPIGFILFLGDWLFGSIGWGVIHGVLFLVAIALSALLVALGVSGGRLGVAFLIAAGVAVGVSLGLAALGLEGRVAAALGVTLGLIVWPISSGVAVARAGIDTDALKARFWPSGTIETTKETIEWVREQTPLGRKS